MNDLPASTADPVGKQIERQRRTLLRRLEGALEIPMLVLGLVWLALLVVELGWGLGRTLELLGLVIWIIFIADFVMKFALAPAKQAFLRDNWVTALALLLPALRVLRVFRAFRVLRAARTLRGVRLARLLTSLNRGMKTLGGTMRRRGLAYMVLLTLLVTFAGAAGMYAFEGAAGQPGMSSYGDALWWTAMMMTTMGSEFWPATTAGRILCLLLALYAFSVFGYFTASLATHFIGKDAKDHVGVAGASELKALRREIADMRAELRRE
jgi:voltage-gated potassium channel